MHRIMLTFENITLPCSQGSLIPRNGMSMDSPAFPGIPNLCDTKNGSLPQLITQGNRAYLQFSTTAPASAYFRIKYEQFAAGCGGKVTGISGFISAPQYPLKDSRSLKCDWSISVGEGNRVKLTFSFIDNLDSADTRGECNAFGANYIDISNGPYADNSLIKRFCTRKVQTEPLKSDGNQLSVKYVQHGGSYHGALFGFLAHFDTYCTDIVLTEHHGSIQSPGFPGPIEDGTNLACKWTIRTTPGSRIILRFHNFDLKSKLNGFICSNYLLIPSTQVQNISAEGVAPTFQKTKFCEYYIPKEISSKNNTLTLEYNLRGSRPENNFWVSWTTLGCGGIILRNNSDIIVLQSHFTTDKEERQCQWTIKAPIGFVAKFSFEFGNFMGLPDQRQACDDVSKTKRDDYDGIEFYAGTDNSSGIPQKIMCKIFNNETWTSQTNEVFALMRYSPRNMMSKNGVILKGKVEFVKLENDASCGGIIQRKLYHF
uniref:CUB domain-containing protein n=1 Tax=Panagrolaimus davidi TaxID=227884 RepID=A0A914P7J4_9BILA